jgi:hypothetical protein
MTPAHSCLGLLILAVTSAAAQAPVAIAPAAPADGSVLGARPLFEIAYDGIDDTLLRQARFRIVLSHAGSGDDAYVFDQREHRAGWIPGEPGRILYRPHSPLDDGSYTWRASFWNGARWVEEARQFRLRIDTVPPADVEGLRLMLDRDDGAVSLSWDPVVLDRTGRAEFVARYHLFRYTSGPPWPLAPAYRVATTPAPEWVDELPHEGERLVLFRVTAEDEAGNEASGNR